MSNRLVVLGGGISGLVISKLLSDKFDEILIIEKDSQPYGLCRTKLFSVNGYPNIPIDVYGGHIFNSKDPRVLDFVFSYLPREQWFQLERNAKIYLDGKIVGWPFEYSLFEFGADFMEQCLNEMYGKVDTSNLRQYFLTKYGKTACDKYYFPYNEKIWQKPLETIGTQWMNPAKIPTMDADKIRVRNIPGSKDTGMTHSKFFYPRIGGIQGLLERIRASIPNLIVKCSQENYSIRNINDQWHIKFANGCIPCDLIISTIPVNDLRQTLGMLQLEWLQCHGTDFVVVETDFFQKHPDITWCYFPERGIKFHKLANISYTHQKEHPIALIDAPYKSYRMADKESKKWAEDPFLTGYKFRTLEVIRREKTYPIEPAGHQEELKSEIESLEKVRIYSTGRWANHQYINMDITIAQSMSLAERIRNEL